MIQIDTNIDLAIALLRSASIASQRAPEVARKAVAEHVYLRAKQGLQEIYDQPDTEDYFNGDYLGRYIGGSGLYRSGALKAKETLLHRPSESVIFTEAGTFNGHEPVGYAQERDRHGRAAGHLWRERAAADGEHEGKALAEKAILAIMPEGLVVI